jgi:hypothetical protein
VHFVVLHAAAGIDAPIEKEANGAILGHGVGSDPNGPEKGPVLGVEQPHPEAHPATVQVLQRPDPGVLPANHDQIGAVHHLGEVNQGQAFAASLHRAGEKERPHLGLPGSEELRRVAVRPAVQDLHVQAPASVEAVLQGEVVPGELGLMDPLESQADLHGRSGRGRDLSARRDKDAEEQCQPEVFPHRLPPP